METPIVKLSVCEADSKFGVQLAREEHDCRALRAPVAPSAGCPALTAQAFCVSVGREMS